MTEKKLYTDDSIQTLTPREHVRLRSGMYVGSTEYATQLLMEIIANAIDEWKIGNCTEINIYTDGSKCIVTDNGQGFPIKTREDGKSILEASFSAMNTSGKYSNEGVYEGTSLGLNGVGAKATNFLSHKCIVTTTNDEKTETITFVEGEFNSRKIENTPNKKTGTVVEWEASEEFFDHPEVEIEKIKKSLQTFVCLCKGLTITFQEKDSEKITYYSEKGLEDIVDKSVKKELIEHRFITTTWKDKSAFDIVLTYGEDYGTKMLAYVNIGETEAGPHITQLKSAITREFNKFFREKKWLKEKEENLSGADLSEGMIVAFNYTTTNVAYDAQTKTRISKIDTTLITDTISLHLYDWMNDFEDDIKKIFDKAYKARKAREAARRAREAVRKPKKEKGLKAAMQLSDKYIDCTNKKSSERNLLIVEGLSAGASTIEARDPKRDAIYMLRGKILSTLKQDIDKILKNQELSDIIRVIGAGFNETFDLNKANFNKIVITSDQDADGENIELLLITFFFTYMRELVTSGKLYRAVTPLYIVRYKGNELYFYSDKEFDEWKENKNGYDITRCKGLGELNATDLKKVCFEQQRFKRITVSDCEAAEELLEILMGKAIQPRKDYIYENARELGFNFD